MGSLWEEVKQDRDDFRRQELRPHREEHDTALERKAKDIMEERKKK